SNVGGIHCGRTQCLQLLQYALPLGTSSLLHNQYCSSYLLQPLMLPYYTNPSSYSFLAWYSAFLSASGSSFRITSSKLSAPYSSYSFCNSLLVCLPCSHHFM